MNTIKRNKNIDICKGLLIWFVILGHSGFQSMEWFHDMLFWFHMPCFFILTGYLTNWNKYSLKDFICKRFHSYLIPYFVFSIVLIIIYQDWVKGTIKTIAGGRINTSSYSYPFWFITALFLSVCIYKSIINCLNWKNEFIVCSCMWLVGHAIALLPEVPALPGGGRSIYS